MNEEIKEKGTEKEVRKWQTPSIKELRIDKETQGGSGAVPEGLGGS